MIKFKEKSPFLKNIPVLLTLLAVTNLVFLSGCVSRFLTVYLDVITEEHLASYHVDTPDPLLNCPPFGEQLIIKWAIPRPMFAKGELRLKLTLRLRNHEQFDVERVIPCLTGTWVYSITNDWFSDTGGIATYKVELSSGDQILDIWKHHLWEEWITLQPLGIL